MAKLTALGINSSGPTRSWMCSAIPHTELFVLLLTAIPLRSHWSWTYIPLKQKEWTVLVLRSWLCRGISQNPQRNMNIGLSHKWLHFFLNRRQERTSSLSHCTLIICKRLSLDKKASRHKCINMSFYYNIFQKYHWHLEINQKLFLLAVRSWQE